MVTLDINKLRHLLKQEEGPKLDFKAQLSLFTESEKKELTRDVIAIANSRGGRGHILFGVEDKTKKILGVDPHDFKEEQIQQIIYNRCDPPVPVLVDFIEIESKYVAVLTIYKSSHQPHQMLQNGAFYVRRGSTTDTARRAEIASLLQENGFLTYETVILNNASMSELDFNLIRQYFANMNVVSENPSEILLQAMGIIGASIEGEEYCPTIGGVLVFGRNPSMFLPQAFIRISCGEEVKCFYGNILSILDNASEYIKTKLDDANYPFEAVEEAIANALAHRDYLDVSRCITISINRGSIEISNPGALIAGNSVYKYLNGANQTRRNAWLYQRLLILDTKKRFLRAGNGMKRIEDAFKGIGEPKFINLGTQNLFKVILPKRK